jgi:predicted membrane-bound mannosyltransferase
VSRALTSYVAVVAYADGAVHDYLVDARNLEEAEQKARAEVLRWNGTLVEIQRAAGLDELKRKQRRRAWWRVAVLAAALAVCSIVVVALAAGNGV